MEHGQTSFDLLAHFDAPKRDDNLESAIKLPMRGMRWVLERSAALAVLTLAAGILIQFAYLLAAEHQLNLAARAGAMEATLPRASEQTVKAAIERRLSSYPLLARQVQTTLTVNGTPISRQLRPNDGDRIAVTLSAPTNAVIPAWLRTLMPWRTDSQIQGRAERQIPSRKLALGTGSPALGAGLPTPPRH